MNVGNHILIYRNQRFIKREYNFIESLAEITNKYKISQVVYDKKISYTKYMVMTYTTLITFFFEAMQQDSHVSNAFPQFQTFIHQF